MNRRKSIFITVLILAITALLFVLMFVINVYGDIVRKSPENIFAEPGSTIDIKVVPVNAFGWELPFRHSSSEFSVIQGHEIIEIVEMDSERGFLRARSKGIPGKVEISIKSEFSLLRNLISFEIFALTG